MRLLPDTNLLVYDTVENSENHDDAAKIIDEAKEIIVPSIVIHEYIWVMLRVVQAPFRFIALKVCEYLEDPRVTYMLEPADIIVEALKMLEENKEDPREINDYIILAMALRHKSTLATFDQKLRKKALEKGLKVAP